MNKGSKGENKSKKVGNCVKGAVGKATFSRAIQPNKRSLFCLRHNDRAIAASGCCISLLNQSIGTTYLHVKDSFVGKERDKIKVVQQGKKLCLLLCFAVLLNTKSHDTSTERRAGASAQDSLSHELPNDAVSTHRT